MKRNLTALFLLFVLGQSLMAQYNRTVQNRPYTDLRPFHFGILIGTHMQDLELMNVGPQVITGEDGTETTRLITCDLDRYDQGFNVGVLGEFRLSEHFQFRIAPAMYFGARHISFHDFTPSGQSEGLSEAGEGGDAAGEGETQRMLSRQSLKSAYISCAFDLIFASKRNGNLRPYMMAGVNPMINLTGRPNDYIRLKRNDVFAEVGAGCDVYLPFFKLRPELKFMFGLTDCLDRDHPNHLTDQNMRAYANSVSKAVSKMVVLTFYFE